MNWDVFITCAVTGVGDTVGRSDRVPVTPEQIADSAIEAAEAGAAVVHIHVRDPETGAGSRDPILYRRVVERIRASGTDAVLNLTAGMGGDLVLGGDETPVPFDADGTDLAGATERLAHVEELLPEICTLDCGSMNFAAGGDYVLLNTPGILRAMARRVQELGVRPELEVFDTGHLWLVKDLIAEGLIDEGAIFSTFSIGRMQLPWVAMAALVGGNVRVGLEDNIYLSRGRLASNGDLVERAVRVLESMNVNVLGPEAVREKLRLRARV